MSQLAAHQAAGESMASKHAASASSRADRAERKVKMLEENLAKTLLICEALWEMLSQRTGLTVQDLHNKLYELDMRDGTLDGKNQRKAVECPSCARMVGPHHSVCLYCGQVIDDSVFRM
jgi:ribosomal protein L32